MNESYKTSLISNVTTNTFDISVNNTGATGGTVGAYMPIFDISLFDVSTGDYVLQAPNSGNAQLLSVNFYIDSFSATTLNFDFGGSIFNGAGSNASISSLNIPTFQIWDVTSTNVNPFIEDGTLTFDITTFPSTFRLATSIGSTNSVYVNVKF